MLGPVDRSDVLETTKEIQPFTQLLSRYGNEPLVMTGLRPKIYVDFQIPRDEIATDATIFLKWTASPSLIPVRSQVNVRLNGEMQMRYTYTGSSTMNSMTFFMAVRLFPGWFAGL